MKGCQNTASTVRGSGGFLGTVAGFAAQSREGGSGLGPARLAAGDEGNAGLPLSFPAPR